MSAVSNILQYRVELWKVLLSVSAILSIGILGRNFCQPPTSTTDTNGTPTTADESSEKKEENGNAETGNKGDLHFNTYSKLKFHYYLIFLSHIWKMR